jgi:chorismate-pyruvate lyase
MSIPVRPITGPRLETLFAHFPSADDQPAYDIIPAHAVPAPYQNLLVHAHHMTVTVEAHHGAHVDVRILARRHEGDSYARKILLTLQGSDRIVQFGIVRIDLRQVGPEVRTAIVAGKTPIGRILIQHDVLRRIEPTAFLRIDPGPKQMAWFALEAEAPRPIYGRLALIHCNGRPALELLEVVAPE